MPRTIIVHIGRNKTGTSSLQRSLADARQRLIGLGFDYPRPGINHHYLANHLSRRKRRRLPSEKIADADVQAGKLEAAIAASDAETILLSSEAFQTCPPRLLAEWIGEGVEVKIVIYLREQLDWLSSFYQQAVKARLVTATLDVFAERYDPDYVAVLAPWERVFGRENVVVRVYDRARLVDGDVVADFLSVIGVGPGEVPTLEGDANPSIGGPLLEAKRRLNGLGLDEERLRLATLVPLRRLAEAEPALRAKPTAPAAFVEAFRARYVESNAAVAARYFGGAPLFKLRPYAPGAAFSEADVETVLDRLVALTADIDAGTAATIRERLVSAAQRA